MADNSTLKEFPITWEKGLVTEVEESTLELGQASELLNWEPSAGGGLRARNAWQIMSKTGLTSPYKVRGFGTIATGAGGTSVTAPVVAQGSHWPNAAAEPIKTKTLTLNGVGIGNVLVAVVSEDSSEVPSVTAGWTQRAIGGSAAQNFVKFYTKVAAASTEAFTYTIAASRIRAVSLYEVQYADSADPGTIWAVDTQNAGSPGSSSITANPTDTDGGIGFVGYLYDGGTPDTTDSGTSGWIAPTQDNANTQTGVRFEDLDQLDGSIELPSAGSSSTSLVYTTASWTPPSSGLVIVLVGVGQTASGDQISTMSVTGNGLTWHDCIDAGELGNAFILGEVGNAAYAWADCALGTPTEGTITVTIGGGAFSSGAYSFVRAVGADVTDPFVQTVNLAAADGTTGPTLSALGDGSGLLGVALQSDEASPNAGPAVATIGPGNWEVAHDGYSLDNTELAAGYTFHHRFAYSSSTNSPDAQATWLVDANAYNAVLSTWEIKGQGTAAKIYHGPYTGAGSATEGFNYVANKRITAKSMFLGFTPPLSDPGAISFYIVMAVASSDTEYKIYKIVREDILSGTWTLLDTFASTNSAGWVTFAQGAGKLIWSSSTVANPRQILISAGSASNVPDLSSKAGRASAYHKDRMFVGGSTDIPGRLYFSGIGDPDTFTTATDFLDIGGDDGEAIQDLVSVEGLLMVCKNNRIYLISGSGIESFFVNELPGGTAAAGRPAVRTPYGTIVAGPDDIWVVQGGGVDPMSRPLGGGYAITGNVSTAYAQDSVIITDATTGKIFRVNLVTGAWSEESVKANAPYINFSLNGRLYYGTNGSSVQVGGKRQLTDNRNYDAVTDGTAFRAATGKLALLGPSARYTARHLYLQLRNHTPGNMSPLHIEIESDVAIEESTIEVTEEVRRLTISLGKHKGAEWLQFRAFCGSSATAGAIDIEKGVLSVYGEKKRP